MTLVGAVVAGTLGSLLGAWLLYWLGRKFGQERLLQFADHHGRWLTLSRQDIERASAWFSPHGAWAVLVCRLIPGLRSLISIPAGIQRMPLGVFVACTALGSALWTAALVGLGYVLGANFEQVERYVGPVSNAVVGIIVVMYAWRVITHKGAART